MVSYSSQDLFALLIVLLVVGFIARRSVAMSRGTTLSIARLLVSMVLYLGLFALVTLGEVFYLPLYVILAEIVAVVVVGLSVVPWVQRRVEVYRDPAGGWSFRMGVTIPVLYLALFLLRIALDFLVLGVDPFGPLPAGFTLSTSQTALLAIVDGLYALSTGLVVARTLGIYRAYSATPKPARAPGG